VEAGLKLNLLQRQLHMNFGAYHYKYTDLQLSRYNPTILVTTISNASAAKVRGVEADFSYEPGSVPNLRFFGAISYNIAKYSKSFLSACWIGQTIAEGCSVDVDGNGIGDFQDLDGRPLPRAPKWAGNIGFSYSTSIGNGLKLGLDNRLVYQSRSFLSQESLPFAERPETLLLDAGLRFSDEDDRWELAVIGKNLTNKFYAVSGTQESGTGDPATTGTNSGLRADYWGAIHRGREILLRATLRFGAGARSSN